ncbi:MAG: EamA family transporter, partial [candidate division Zixibacteria bacterium]|nr:EamA family transporter [candidate division Zixibacteria bacterium]
LGSLLEGESILPSSFGALGLVYSLALVAQVGGWLAIYVSLTKLPASLSALTLLLQPTFATLWGAVFFAEAMTDLQFFGGAITLAAIYLGASRGNR